MQFQYGESDYFQLFHLLWHSFCANTEVNTRIACINYKYRVKNRQEKFFLFLSKVLFFQVKQLEEVSVMHFHLLFSLYFVIQHCIMWLCEWIFFYCYSKNGLMVWVWDTFFFGGRSAYNCQISSFVLAWSIYNIYLVFYSIFSYE